MTKEINLDAVSLGHNIDKQPQQKSFQMHLHDLLEIYIFISGDAKYVIEGNEYELSHGDLLLVRESESHCINFLSDMPYERYVIHMKPSALDAVDPERRLLRPFYDRPLGTDNLYRPTELPGLSALSYMRAMFSEDGDTYDQTVAVTSNMLPLLRDIGEAFKKKKSPDAQSSIAGQLTAYINSHLFDELSVQSIANYFFMSVSQVERIFKRSMHSSVWQYINAKRLAAARRMIEDGTPAYTASVECAFGDYSSFYRAYVKAYGERPSSYKKQKQ